MNFTDVADQVGLGQIALDYVGWGTAFLDFDNDGWLDLFVANGSTFQQYEDPRLLVPMRMQLFWNKGSREGFFDLGPVSGEVFERKYVGRGVAVGDYDNDGDPDVFVVVNGGPAMLLRNEGVKTNHWLKVRLVGGGGNRFGLGAKLRVVAGGKAAIREVGAGSSYLSQNAVGEELFGLGAVDRVDSLKVTWPDGVVQQLIDLAVDQIVVVTREAGGGMEDSGGGGQ